MKTTLLALGLALCAASASPAPAAASLTLIGPYFDGLGDVVGQGVVVVEAGRIRCAGATGRCRPDRGGRVITVDDGLILPGLIDLHVHARSHYLRAFPAAGVTTLRDANNTLETIARLEAQTGAPRIVAAGPMLDGEGSVVAGMSETAAAPGGQPWERIMPVLVTEPGQASAAVAALADRGVGVIKLYEQLPPDAFLTATATARRLGLPVMADLGVAGTRGLTAATVDALEAARAGVTTIEHLSGFALAYRNRGGDPHAENLDEALLDRLADEFRATGAAVVPTLTNTVHALASEPPDLVGIPVSAFAERTLGGWWQQLFATHQREDLRQRSRVDGRFARALLPRLAARGVPIGAGTDTPAAPFTVPGGGLHQELEYLVEFGLSPRQALVAATGGAAALLGRQDLGVIRDGAVADLVVVKGKPLADITHTRRLVWVVMGGEPHQAADLARTLR